jgi:hypothetical protein
MITENLAEKPKPQTVVSERSFERPTMTPPPVQSASSWEDSPKFVGESRGILTPSSPTRRAPSVSDSSGLRTPYIPAPAPKLPPPSVIVGPMTGPTQPKIIPRPTRPSSSQKNPVPTASPTPRASSEATKPRADPSTINPSPATPPSVGDVSTISEKSEKTQSDDKGTDDISGKETGKPSDASKKKFPYDQD